MVNLLCEHTTQAREGQGERGGAAVESHPIELPLGIGFEDHRLVHIGQRLRVPVLALLLDALLSNDELLKGTHGNEKQW